MLLLPARLSHGEGISASSLILIFLRTFPSPKPALSL